MTTKIRIYQLAKELGLENKALLTMLEEMGVEAKSHASSLDDETAEAVRALVAEPASSSTETSASVAAGDAAATDADAATPASPVNANAKGKKTAAKQVAKSAGEAPTRAPVVTVMGHVDHGKTSLLDYIRQTRVAAREAGGITQHIGAYVADTAHGPITFLDTPGHEAFTAIRQRGATVTDIVVVVVAADDGVMPQTREAIAHAKAAAVPIIVAINKIDLPQADVDRVKQELMQVELVPEEYGGDTIVVPISAATGDGVPDLLEMIGLVAEVEDLRADPDAPAIGTVVESVLDKRAGVLATVLVQQGTLRVADYVVSGEAWAKIRRITDYTGAGIDAAGPSVPVQVLGFSNQPVAGARVEAVADEVTAKRIAAERRDLREEEELTAIGRKNVTLADLFGKPKTTTINVIVRADTQGSLEALKAVLGRAADGTDEVDLNVMLADVGAPTESDLLLASTADAHLFAFGVTAPGSVVKSAERKGIPLKTYRIIYELIEDVERLIRGQIEPEFEESILGHAEVRAVIHVPRSGNIAGCYVTDGLLRRNAKVRVTREGKEVYKGTLSTLKRFKDDVREVTTGFECGVNLQNYDNVQVGDVIEAYDLVEVPVS